MGGLDTLVGDIVCYGRNSYEDVAVKVEVEKVLAGDMYRGWPGIAGEQEVETDHIGIAKALAGDMY